MTQDRRSTSGTSTTEDLYRRRFQVLAPPCREWNRVVTVPCGSDNYSERSRSTSVSCTASTARELKIE